MPWTASSVMEERLRFVARLLDGEAMTDVCRDFGVSRKTGYKIFDRYKEHGLTALSDRSRRPVRYGRLCLHRKRINISSVLACQRLGIKEVDEGIWLVSFMHYDLGYFDLEQKTLQPLDNPFGTRLSPMS
jgi:transposase-like protein